MPSTKSTLAGPLVAIALVGCFVADVGGVQDRLADVLSGAGVKVGEKVGEDAQKAADRQAELARKRQAERARQAAASATPTPRAQR